jgi:peroxiredoxin (alkyl hydroperoxide reductase subunit C)
MFYPADFSGVCTSELEEIVKAYAEFKELGTEVVTISTDSVHVHRAWRAQSEMIRSVSFPMGADPSGKIALAFGVLVEGGDIQFLQGEGMALRGTFVVDPKGILRTMEVQEPEMARSTKETLRKLKAAQFIDKGAGNVCPAGWEGE